MSNPVTPVGEIRVVQDGDVYRIVDDAGRRYYSEPKLWACWLAERDCIKQGGWEIFTAFSEREADLLVDAINRERKVLAEALAVADDLAAAFLALTDGCGVARAWRGRRSDG